MVPQLWVLRCFAIQHLRLYEHLATELAALFDILPEPYPALRRRASDDAEPFFHPLLPFELLVYRARASALLGNHELAFSGLWILVRSLFELFRHR